MSASCQGWLDLSCSWQHLQLGDSHAVPAASGAVPSHEAAGLRASTAAPIGAGTPRFLRPDVSQALPSTNR